MSEHNTLFNIQGQTAVITGGSGVLGTEMARALVQAGARVAIISVRPDSARKVAESLTEAGGEAFGLACDVTDKAGLEQARVRIQERFGVINILINGAGGNQPGAVTGSEQSFFELDEQAIERVFHVNMTGTLLPCQVFGRAMAEQGQGSIINISSMAALRPLTKVVAYSAAKAAVTNFTQWLAVHIAQEYNPHIRVNAIAPGFFFDRAESFLAHRCRDGRVDCTRPEHSGPYTDGTIWQSGGSHRNAFMASEPGSTVYYGNSCPRRWWVFGL